MRQRFDQLVDRQLGHRPALARLARYGAVSAIGVLVTQVTLLLCVIALGMASASANVVAVTTGAVPSYLINRAWVWQRRDSHSLGREVLPFWAMALAGLALSTFTVAWADRQFDGAPLALSLANISAFGVLWSAKFVVLDKVLFAD